MFKSIPPRKDRRDKCLDAIDHIEKYFNKNKIDNLTTIQVLGFLTFSFLNYPSHKKVSNEELRQLFIQKYLNFLDDFLEDSDKNVNDKTNNPNVGNLQ